MSSTAESFLVGLIGSGVTPTLSAGMHETEADHQGLRYIYRPIDLDVIDRPAEAVGELLRNARELGYNAFNITHPCKQLVLEHLDEVSDDARQLGAVNTVLIRDGRFFGFNTDFSGFSSGLAEGLPDVNLDSVVQLGAGGAGSAVAYALLHRGVSTLRISDVDHERAGERVAALRALFPDRTIEAITASDLPAALHSADGLVNATPIGMRLHPGLPLDASLLNARLWVADVVYRPIDTALIIAARAAGCRVLDGGHMAVGQAVDAFELITGLTADAPRMRAHFLTMIAAGL